MAERSLRNRRKGFREKVLVLAERLRKKDTPGRFIKVQQKIKAFLTETEFSQEVKDQN